MNEVKRSSRIAARMRDELAVVLQGLADPRLSGAVITRVEVTDDLQSAKVHVRSPTVAAEDDKARRGLLKAFDSASGRLRKEIARSMALRLVPTLRFYFDDQPEASGRIEELLREIHEDEQKR